MTVFHRRNSTDEVIYHNEETLALMGYPSLPSPVKERSPARNRGGERGRSRCGDATGNLPAEIRQHSRRPSIEEGCFSAVLQTHNNQTELIEGTVFHQPVDIPTCGAGATAGAFTDSSPAAATDTTTTITTATPPRRKNGRSASVTAAMLRNRSPITTNAQKHQKTKKTTP